MPIKGLTDQAASFPRIGELRKGAPKPASGNRPGSDLEYFRFTSKDSDVHEKFYNEYGNTPNEINCYLPYATADENFEAWVEEWAAGGLKWRGDGETLVIWQKPDGTYSQQPKPQPEGGKQVGRLKIIIPELGRLAYVVALTTSIHDIMSMPKVLRAYEALRGDLRGIPFVLSRVPRMVSTPSGKNGRRARREKWLLHLEAQTIWVQAQLSAMQRAALPSGVDAYNNDSIIDIETGEIFDDDFEDGEHETHDVRNLPGSVTPDEFMKEFDRDMGRKHNVVPEVIQPEEVKLTGRDDYEQHISPGDSTNADCRAWLEDKIKDGKTTLGMVLDAAEMTPHYNSWKHAFNALSDYEFPDGFKMDRKQEMTGKGALIVYDWLVERKIDTGSDEEE